jgi:hypothetical protein
MSYIVHWNLFHILLYELKCHIRLKRRLPYCPKEHFIHKFLETSEKLATRLLFGSVSYPYLVENYCFRSEHFHSICNVFKTIHTKSYFENFEIRDHLAGPSIVVIELLRNVLLGWGTRTFATLRSVVWQFLTDVSGQHILPTFTCKAVYLADFLEWEVFETKFVVKIKTLISYSVTFFFPENRAVYEIIWKNMVQPYRPQMTI